VLPETRSDNKVLLDLSKVINPIRKDIISSAKKILRYTCQTCDEKKPLKTNLYNWIDNITKQNSERYSSFLYCEDENLP